MAGHAFQAELQNLARRVAALEDELAEMKRSAKPEVNAKPDAKASKQKV